MTYEYKEIIDGMTVKAVYVPWLHMHQPLVWHRRKLVGNLKMMLFSKDSNVGWNAELMARAYKNPAKHIKVLTKRGLKPKIMLDFSGILLESLKELTKNLKKTYVDGEKIGDIIKLYKEVLKKYPSSIEFAGTAYSHCYFPVTPERDWKWQVEEWRNTFKRLFGNKALKEVKGFWLPEMGIPGQENKLVKLIKTLKDCGYEWMILPIEAVEGEKEISQEQRIIMTSQPHLLSVKDESIVVVLRARYDFIDQQAGCDAECVYEKCLKAISLFRKKSRKPALVVPASDGENGNVMLNEFFPQTFIPFFKGKIDKKISSLTITEFLREYYDGKITSSIKLKKVGGSWVGGHEQWVKGSEREIVSKGIEKTSKRFHGIDPKGLKGSQRKLYEDTKRMLLISETSCYTYWGTSFWFSQWEKINEILLKLLKKLYL